MNSTVDINNKALMSGQQGHKGHINSHMALMYGKTKNKTNTNGGWGIPMVGVTLVSIAVFLYLLNPVYHIITHVRKFGPNTFMFNKWLTPPVKVNLNFYVFNYTNSEAFMRGEEELKIQELGPYSFQEIPSARNITFNENNTVTYIPTKGLIEDPEGTVGNLLEDVIVVPNFIFLGLASYLSESSFFTNMAFNVFAKMVKSQAFLTMTVDEYLRGYDEPLLNYAKKIVPGMIPIDKMSFIDRIVYDGENIVTMNLNGERVVRDDGSTIEAFSLDTYNGSPGLERWGYDHKDNTTHKLCNTLRGVATEGVLVPRKMTEDIQINYFRKAFCRTMQIVYDGRGVTSWGVPAFWYKFTKDNFHNSNPENSCYCLQKPCLPDGLSDISPCLFNMPWAISSPHYLYGDPALAEAWEGIEPSEDKHGSIGLLDETFGIIVHAKLRIQLNLVVKNTRHNTEAIKFSNMVLPAMWAEYHFNEIPDSLHSLLYFSVIVLPKLVYVFEALLAFVGIILLLSVFVRSPSHAIYRRLFLYTKPRARLHTVRVQAAIS